MPRGNRHNGIALAVLAVFLVFIATLTPASPNTPTSGPFCLLCGDAGTIDVVQNVVLFLPLGYALAWLGASRGAVIATAFALSAFVEALQLSVIPGRDASLGDLVFNTLGGAVGFALLRSRVNPLAPSRPVLHVLRGAAALAWALVMLGASFGLRPASPLAPGHSWRLTAPHDSTDSRFFSGEARAILVNDVQLFVSEPASMKRSRVLLGARPSTVTLVVIPGRPTSEYAHILAVHAGRSDAFAFGQAGYDLHCERHLLASRLLLRTPSFVLPDAFAGVDPAARTPGQTWTLRCTWEDGHVIVARVAADDSVQVNVPLTPGLGWTLFLPAHLGTASSTTTFVNFAWLLAIAVPLGFWSRSGLPTQIAILGTLLVVQRVLPSLAQAATSPPSEYAATLCGFLLGAGVAHLMRRRHAPSIRG